MPNDKARALRARFGLSALDTPPVIFQAVQGPQVWGGLGAPADDFEAAIGQDAARAEFVEWLSASYPGLVEAVIEALGVDDEIAAEAGLGGFQDLVDQVMQTAQKVLPAYMQYDQQKEILAMQLDRARQGLPPLQTGEFAPSVQIGLDQDTIARMADEARQRAAASAGALFNSPVTWIAGGVGALLLWRAFSGGKGRRRRA